MQSEFNVPKHALKLTLILRLHLATVATVASWDWCDCHSSPHAGGLRACGRPHRPGARHNLRAPGRHHGAVEADCRAAWQGL